MRPLLLLALLFAVGCADSGADVTVQGVDPAETDGDLAPDAELQPQDADLAPEADLRPDPPLAPEATLQPDSTR